MARVYTKREPGDRIGVGGAILLQKIDNRLWKIGCKCGNTFIGQPSESKGFCRACAYDYVKHKVTKHGESPDTGKKASRLYRIWVNMRARCHNKNNPNYKDYGGRGIFICKEWDDYTQFKSWSFENGYSNTLSIDRIDVNGHYCPENCRWVDQKTQMQNTRSTIKAEGVSLKKWCEDRGINYDVVKHYRQKHPEISIEELLDRYRNRGLLEGFANAAKALDIDIIEAENGIRHGVVKKHD